MSTNQQKQFSLLPKIVNGSIAGIIGVSTVFPLDLVKTRLQNQTVGPDGKQQYHSILDCFKKTYRAEGYFGMYKGSGVNILLVTPEKAIKLSANDFFRYRLAQRDVEPLTVMRSMAAGGLAGLCAIVITTPMELLKIQLQNAGSVTAQMKLAGESVPKISATSIALDLSKTKGLVGLYKGTLATALRDVPFAMFYFPLFAQLNSLGPRRDDGSGETPFYWSFLSGCVSGSVAALTVTPFDVIKTRLQVLTKGVGELHYNGIWDAIIKTFRNEGIKAFFKGGACRMVVIGPLFGITQMVYYFGVAEHILGIQ